MLDSSIVGVVIGLVFVFSLLAILVTYINNAVVAVLNLRAKQLKQGLVGLIQDRELQAKILAHPLIQMVDASVSPDSQLTTDQAEAIINAPTTKVSYIAPSTFVEALKSILLTESLKTLFVKLQDAIDVIPSSVDKSKLREYYNTLRSNFTEETLRSVYDLVEQVPDEGLRDALVNGIEDVEITIRTLSFQTGDLLALINGVEQVNNPHLREALRTVLSTAQSLQDAESKITNWFNDGMNRVSEIFKRRLQLYSMLAAFMLAIVLNVDTLYLARVLWEDPELRQSVTEQAVRAEQQGQVRVPQSMTEQQFEAQARDVQETVQLLLDLQLPIGWGYTPVTGAMIEKSLSLGLPSPYTDANNFWNYFPANNDNWLSLLFKKIIGILITTVAAAQGAPFWFDLLRKLTSSSKS